MEKHLSAVTGRDAAQKEIEKLQATGDKLARRIQQEKRRIEQLDAGIADQEKITKQKMRVGGANASKENARRLNKHIKLLESRLDNALKRYNKALAVNKGLRKQVDESRQERVIFDGVYKKLEWQLHENKMRIKELDKQAENSFCCPRCSQRRSSERLLKRQSRHAWTLKSTGDSLGRR